MFRKPRIASGGVYHGASNIFLALIDEHCELAQLRHRELEVDCAEDSEWPSAV